MNDIGPNYNDSDPSWTVDFKEILDKDLDKEEGELLSDFLSELFKDEDIDEDEESDKHPLNELIKDIH